MVRTFIAFPIKLPEELVHARAELAKMTSPESVRWVNPLQSHITLCFIGNISQLQVKTISRGFQELYNEVASFKIQVKGLGTFGSRSEAGVLWAGLEGADPIFSLRSKTLDFIAPLLEGKFPQNFHPHITLARMKNKLNKHELINRIRDYHHRYLGLAEISRVIFYKSTISIEGSDYEIIEEAIFR